MLSFTSKMLSFTGGTVAVPILLFLYVSPAVGSEVILSTGSRMLRNVTVEHHGRTLHLIPGIPLLAYALQKGPPPRPNRLCQTRPVHEYENAHEDEDPRTWHDDCETIAQYERQGTDDEGVWVDSPDPWASGFIDSNNVAHGVLDLIWAFEGVPSWDEKNHHGLSDETFQLFGEYQRVNPPKRIAHGPITRMEGREESRDVTGSVPTSATTKSRMETSGVRVLAASSHPYTRSHASVPDGGGE